MPEIQELIEQQGRAFEEFKAANDARLKEIEKKGSADAVTVGKVEALNKQIGDLEAQIKSAADAKKLEDAMAEVGELRGSMDQLTAAFKRGAFGPNATGPSEERQSFRDWARKGGRASEFKGLRLDVDTQGGVLAPSEMVRDIIKDIIEVSPVRQLVRVRSTSTRTVMHPKRTGTFAAVWVSELQSRPETDGLRYGMHEIPTQELIARVPISMADLEDSAFDMEAEIRAESIEQFALAEGSAVVNGDGIGGKPEGFMTNADVGFEITGAATAITADSIIDMAHTGVKTGYAMRGIYTMNRRTMGSVRKLKDNENQYLWRMGIAEGAPNTINGHPYIEVPDMPNEAAGTFPVAFGDFRRAYVMADRISMAVQRDEYTMADNGQILFRMRRRVGGQVVLPEAITKLKCATS